jgi:hypothetical protein
LKSVRALAFVLPFIAACPAPPEPVTPATVIVPPQPPVQPDSRPPSAGVAVATDRADPNPPGTTLRRESVFVDPSPPAEWTQCAGFVNTAADDVTAQFLDNCLHTARMRVRVFTSDGEIEEDLFLTDLRPVEAWPNFQYLNGSSTVLRKTYWGGTNGGAASVFFTDDAGRDACMKPVSNGGTTLGSGHAETAIIAGDATGYDEYRISCGGKALPDRKIAVYR